MERCVTAALLGDIERLLRCQIALLDIPTQGRLCCSLGNAGCKRVRCVKRRGQYRVDGGKQLISRHFVFTDGASLAALELAVSSLCAGVKPDFHEGFLCEVFAGRQRFLAQHVFERAVTAQTGEFTHDRVGQMCRAGVCRCGLRGVGNAVGDHVCSIRRDAEKLVRDDVGFEPAQPLVDRIHRAGRLLVISGNVIQTVINQTFEPLRIVFALLFGHSDKHIHAGHSALFRNLLQCARPLADIITEAGNFPRSLFDERHFPGRGLGVRIKRFLCRSNNSLLRVRLFQPLLRTLQRSACLCICLRDPVRQPIEAVHIAPLERLVSKCRRDVAVCIVPVIRCKQFLHLPGVIGNISVCIRQNPAIRPRKLFRVGNPLMRIRTCSSVFFCRRIRIVRPHLVDCSDVLPGERS